MLVESGDIVRMNIKKRLLQTPRKADKRCHVSRMFGEENVACPRPNNNNNNE
jgi:hypothetical protein